jgi:beta-mannosidase
MHYMAREFFAPVLLSGVEDRDKGTVGVYVTSDRLDSKSATLSWTVTDVAGEPLREGVRNLRTPVNGTEQVETLYVHDLMEKRGPRDLVVWLDMQAEGEARQRNVVLFARPKQLELIAKPGISYTVKTNADGTFTIALETRHVALWTWLELDGTDAALSNNFFHMRPGVREQVVLTPANDLSVARLREKLMVRSLVDTYSEQERQV